MDEKYDMSMSLLVYFQYSRDPSISCVQVRRELDKQLIKGMVNHMYVQVVKSINLILKWKQHRRGSVQN